ncbi:uncharacterized protein LOC136036151 [Artemia franciscana]|uniref:Uncharacterized protein n=1 Tax=Artemia franciscana TaxID=6661 RepID=A0AA88IHQ3_ARTSF|nr:hypothetical protein QYM36_004735 [Artemia franciscana]
MQNCQDRITPGQKPYLCRLRQKKKILRSDHLSIEKDFPRFYAKFRDKRSKDKSYENGDQSDFGLLSSDNEVSKKKLYRISQDAMSDILNDEKRMSALTVEMHKLNRNNYKVDMNNNESSKFNNHAPLNLSSDCYESHPNSTTTCIRINSSFDNSKKSAKLKSRLSQISLSDSGYSSNPDLTDSQELLYETDSEVADFPPVVIKIEERSQVQQTKRQDSRFRIQLNSGELLSGLVDYFSTSSLQTLEMYTQSEVSKSDPAVNLCSMEGSDKISRVTISPDFHDSDCGIVHSNYNVSVGHAPSVEIIKCDSDENLYQSGSKESLSCDDLSTLNLSELSLEDYLDRWGDRRESTPDLSEISESSVKLASVGIFLVQNSWLMIQEDSHKPRKLPRVLYCHPKTEEIPGRWHLMQDLLNESGTLKNKVMAS